MENFARVLLLFGLCLTGCNGNPRDVAKARGTVIMDGEALTGGRIMFQPFAENDEKRVGKGALGQIQSDGTFVLSTYADGDGAVIGKHRPVVMGNRKLEEGETRDAPVIEGPDIGMHRLDQVCEVVAGEDNVFTIEFSSKQSKPVKDDD